MDDDWMKRLATDDKELEKETFSGKRGAVALEAYKVINGLRQDVYGKPEDAHATIAHYWNCYQHEKEACHGQIPHMLSETPFDVCMKMALFKIARIQHNPSDRDGFRDAIGYLALACDMAQGKDIHKG